MRIFAIILVISFMVTAVLSFINGNYIDARLDLIYALLLVINEKIGDDK